MGITVGYYYPYIYVNGTNRNALKQVMEGTSTDTFLDILNGNQPTPQSLANGRTTFANQVQAIQNRVPQEVGDILTISDSFFPGIMGNSVLRLKFAALNKRVVWTEFFRDPERTQVNTQIARSQFEVGITYTKNQPLRQVLRQRFELNDFLGTTPLQRIIQENLVPAHLDSNSREDWKQGVLRDKRFDLMLMASGLCHIGGSGNQPNSSCAGFNKTNTKDFLLNVARHLSHTPQASAFLEGNPNVYEPRWKDTFNAAVNAPELRSLVDTYFVISVPDNWSLNTAYWVPTSMHSSTNLRFWGILMVNKGTNVRSLWLFNN